jgi:predicted restriction endonuclease
MFDMSYIISYPIFSILAFAIPFFGSNRSIIKSAIENDKITRHNLRRRVLQAYGNKCACCGETEDLVAYILFAKVLAP